MPVNPPPLLACSAAARQPSQLRPPLYRGPSIKGSASLPLGPGQQIGHAGPQLPARFSPGHRSQPAGPSGGGAAPSHLRAPGNTGSGILPKPGQSWAGLQIPNGLMGSGGFTDDFNLDNLDWLDPEFPAGPAGGTKGPVVHGSRSNSVPLGAVSGKQPWQNEQGIFLPHPKRRRSEYPKRYDRSPHLLIYGNNSVYAFMMLL